jgi:5'-nucleotidase
MHIQSILLTGDDGYNSLGTRVLIAALREKYKLQIAGTLDQQSGVGSKISIHGGFEWGTSTVDDIPALWVDGTPADAVELAVSYFDKPFDLIISGINWGANLGSAIASSGTVGAAQRCLAVELAPRAITFSWDLPPMYYTMKHNGVDPIAEFAEYPGNTIVPLLEKAIEHDFWGCPVLNINFPAQPSKKVVMTKLMLELQQIYDYDVDRTDATKPGGHFKYSGGRSEKSSRGIEYDAAAVDNGYISITPCKYDYLDEKAYQESKNVQFSI